MARNPRQNRGRRELPQVHSDEAPKVYLGEWLAVLGVKPADLARATGIGESMLSLAIKGEKNLGLVNLNRIALALELPIGRLFEPPPTAEALQALGRYSPQELARMRRT